MNPITNKQSSEKDGTQKSAHPLDGYTKSTPASTSSTSEDNSPYYKSQAPTIALPKGGGALKGIDEKFTVNAVNGTSSLQIPLPLTQGRSGFTPSLSLQYNSGSGNSEFGLGWSLGLGSIQRKTDKKLPEYNDDAESDVFMLAGAEDLVPYLGSSGLPVTETTSTCLIKRYRPRIEGLFARIEHIKLLTGSASWWRVTTKDNIVTYYGLTADARIADPESGDRIFKWLPQLVTDHKGNVQEYTYILEDLQQVPTVIHERNHNNGLALFVNRYLKSVKYCNLQPYYISESDRFLPQLPSVLAEPDTVEYLMEAVFDYSDHGAATDISNDAPTPNRSTTQWQCRRDPFSDFHSGFEMRTYRLCRRVLMFHYFKELYENTFGPTLVKSLDFSYQYGYSAGSDYVEADFITSIVEKGYKRTGASSYNRKALPALSFNYELPVWNTEMKTVSRVDAENAPQGLTGPYQWIDLWGEGLPGILTEQGGGWFYKNNKGGGNFDPALQIASKPAVTGLGSSLQWQDLNADGRRQVVSQDPVLPGYFELNDDQQWQPFRSFRERINIDWNNPYTKLIDVDGDGRPDILVTGDSVWTWYKNKGKDGHAIGGMSHAWQDEENGPRLLLNDNVQSIFLADMNGDGMTDIVRVKNGEVCYWPNKGYGRFGRKVTMSNAPWFDNPDEFNPLYITLSDISGTGAADIIYLGNNRCTAWLNLSGNAWNDQQEINPLPGMDPYSKIAVLDFLGNGTGCIVWSSPLPQHAHAPMRYIDLMGGNKPYLMKSYANGMGKMVELTYKSSTHYYLDDKMAGTPWATRLPFPVQCVSKIVTSDTISETTYTQRYCYHHGYYDHEEREFRGFGRVDTKDTDAAAIDDASDLQQAPVFTKTWYHTGAWLRERNLLDAFAQEYYEGQYLADAPYHIKVPTGLSATEYREAYRALKGLPLRQEIYALDDTAKEDTPYTVTSYAYCSELIQPKSNNKHASFYSYQQQSVAWHYEREGGDPRVLHDLTIQVDAYGNVLQKAQVAYPRNSAVLTSLSLPSVVEAKQSEMLITYTTINYTNDVDNGHHYRLRLPYQEKTYQIHNLSVPGGLWQPGELMTEFGNAAEIDLAADTSGSSKKRLLSHSRILYKGNDASTTLTLATIQSLAIEHGRYQLAITDDVIAATYDMRVSQAMLEEGGYIREDNVSAFSSLVTDRYWLPGGKAAYGIIPAQTFYMPFAYSDPWGNVTTVDYWGSAGYMYYMLPVSITDALSNVTSVDAYDWRCLQPQTITDPNDNVSEILYDLLCFPVAMAVKGKGSEADYLTYIVGSTELPLDADIDSTSLDDFWDDPKANASNLLKRATWRCVYDLDSTGPSDPVRVAMIAREEHWEENNNSNLQIRITYTDGFGRVAMHKAQAPDYIDTDPDPDVVYERWISSGKTVYNNKGNAVMQYEPYCSLSLADEPGGFEYDQAEQAANAGVTPRIFYDPLGRVYRTELPDGSFTKTEWTAWKQVVYDNNDNVLDSDWYASNSISPDGNKQDAAEKALVHDDTPTTMYLDMLARPFFTIQVNAWYDALATSIVTENLESHVDLDILGNRLAIHDARGLTPITFKYNQLKAVVEQLSIDSGQQYLLIDAIGQPLYTWDADDREFYYEYDELRRPIKKTVDNGTSKLLEVMTYGEGVASNTVHNLRGKLYKQYDGAGLVEMSSYDFKGNPLVSSRTFSQDYEAHPDWTTIGSVVMESTDYTTSTVYDALSRPLEIITPEDGTTTYSYEETGLLYSVAVQGVHGLSQQIINKIEYNAKGQRTKVQYQHDATTTTTTYKYDPSTFKVTEIRTTRANDSALLQELKYWYDPVGNITFKRDDAQQTVFFDNSIAAPENDYTYDALYRLIEAGGRQHQDDTSPEPANFDDSWRVGKAHVADSSKMRSYIQYYSYDAVGNMTEMRHTVTGASSLNWTRDMDYVDIYSNMLLQSNVTGQMELYDYDARGNMIAGMPHILYMDYNDENRLEHIELQDGRHVYNQYDASGQRVRKVMVNSAAALRHTRKYVGGWEVYEEYNTGSSSVVVERETLHVMDDSARVAMVDTPTIDNRSYGNPPYPEEQIIRYQFTDHLGTAALELNEEAEVISYEEYFPFGSTSFQSVNNSLTVSMKRYRYTGKERDEETGLYYHGARYYVPWLARWCAMDPIINENYNFEKGAPSRNRERDFLELCASSYEYSYDSPVRFFDDTGEQPKLSLVVPMPKSANDMGYARPIVPSKVSFGKKAADLDSKSNAYYSNSGMGWKESGLTVGNPYKPEALKAAGLLNATQAKSADSALNANVNEAKLHAQINANRQGAELSQKMQNPAFMAGYTGYQLSPVPAVLDIVGDFSQGNNISGALNTLAIIVPFGKGMNALKQFEKTIGLGVFDDLASHRGTGAITWQNAGWQQAGLTKVDFGKMLAGDEFAIKQAFRDASENASAIRFDVTSFDPKHARNSITNYEFNHIVNNPELLQKTTFVQNGNVVSWNGEKFSKL